MEADDADWVKEEDGESSVSSPVSRHKVTESEAVTWLDDGKKYLEKQDYKSAVDSFDQVIRHEHEVDTSVVAEAKRLLAECFRFGTGVPKNIPRFLQLARDAAEKGNMNAKLDLAIHKACFGGIDKGKGLSEVKELAKKHDMAGAQFFLGKTTKDESMLRRAAAQKHAGAMKELSRLCAENGDKCGARAYYISALLNGK